jgi:enamine deaminase RidA (YjgF/YER057c/UK114 family)
VEVPPARPVSPREWPRPRGYANGMLVPAGRDLLFIAGMIGWDAQEKVVPGGLAPQFEKALANVVAVLEEAGGRPEDVVRMLVFVTDKKDYLARRAEIGHAWKRVMGRHYPAMALVEVAGLVEDGAVVEIEAVAAIAPRN